MIVIRRHLHGDLAVRREERSETCEEMLVICDPVQRSVRENEIERTVGDKALDLAALEVQHFRTERARRNLTLTAGTADWRIK